MIHCQALNVSTGMPGESMSRECRSVTNASQRLRMAASAVSFLGQLSRFYRMSSFMPDMRSGPLYRAS